MEEDKELDELLNQIILGDDKSEITFTRHPNDFKKMSLLELFEQATLSIDKDGFLKYSESLLSSFIADKIKISPIQTAILIKVFMHYIEDSYSMSLRGLADKLDVSPLKFLNYYNELKELESKNLIHIEHARGNEVRISIPQFTFNVLISGDRIEKLDFTPENFAELSQAIYALFKDTSYEKAEYESKKQCGLDMLKNAASMSEIKWMKEHRLSSEDMIIICVLTYKKIRKDEDSIVISDILERIYFDAGETLRVRNNLVLGRHRLIRSKICEVANGYFVDGRCLSLTEFADNKLLGLNGIQSKMKTEIKFKFLQHLKVSEIKKKKLIFDSALNEDLERIHKVLKPTRFREFQKRSESKGLNSGFISIFYGEPGTGKTEFVKQLALLTKRELLMVNISDIRDKFVGESEKRLNAIFEEYEKACKHFRKAPILLFNEADALISKRTNVNTSVDQMNNSMQNILLQRMEDFKGIMFATTNLKGLMDKAFERRFTMKIKFGRPTKEARFRLVQSRLSFLPKSEVEFISKNYDFTGGQLDNIAKQLEIKELLGEPIDRRFLIGICNQEDTEKKGAQKKVLGFQIQNKFSED